MVYVVPVTFVTIGALSNFFNTSLTVYLRYQALVDEHYYRIMKPSEELKEETAVAHTITQAV